MRNYGQFCPIARGSEILAERWTPTILRNVLLGCRTFNEIAAGAPGLSRALLTRRLRELEHVGVIQIHPKPDGHGSLYEPTPAGRDLQGVLEAIGGWAERWMDVTAEHADPDVVLWSCPGSDRPCRTRGRSPGSSCCASTGRRRADQRTARLTAKRIPRLHAAACSQPRARCCDRYPRARPTGLERAAGRWRGQ